MTVDNSNGKPMPVRRRADRIGSQTRKISWQYWPTAPVEQSGIGEYQEPLVDTLARPDIEDETDITWGLAQSEAHVARGTKARVDVLYGEGTDLRKTNSPASMNMTNVLTGWQMGATDAQLETCMNVCSSRTA